MRHLLAGVALLAACADPPSTTSPDASPDVPVDAAPDVALDVAPVGDPLTWDVRRRGPFRVGYRVLMHTYTPRGASTPRTVPVHVWYPTHVADGPRPTYGRIWRDNEAVVDAAPAPPAHRGGYPLHVYSHGDRSFGGTSPFLVRYFASHGWVTVAPDHVGNTLADTPDPRPLPIHHLRGQDIRAAIDFVAALPQGDPLAGRVVTSRAVLSGHSFGTHTVWSVAGATFDVERIRPRCTAAVRCSDADLEVFRMGLGDARVVAGIPMAGSISRDFFGPEGHRSVRIPLLAMSGTADPVGADAQFMSSTGVDLTWIDVRGGCHQYFALGGCDDIPDSFQDSILSVMAIAFARRHVLMDADATVRGVLDNTIALSDRVTYRRRTP